MIRAVHTRTSASRAQSPSAGSTSPANVHAKPDRREQREQRQCLLVEAPPKPDSAETTHINDDDVIDRRHRERSVGRDDLPVDPVRGQRRRAGVRLRPRRIGSDANAIQRPAARSDGSRRRPCSRKCRRAARGASRWLPRRSCRAARSRRLSRRCARPAPAPAGCAVLAGCGGGVTSQLGRGVRSAARDGSVSRRPAALRLAPRRALRRASAGVARARRGRCTLRRRVASRLGLGLGHERVGLVEAQRLACASASALRAPAAAARHRNRRSRAALSRTVEHPRNQPHAQSRPAPPPRRVVPSSPGPCGGSVNQWRGSAV